MKITTRIITGYGILITLLAALVTYEVITIHRMQSINRNLSRVNFNTAISCLELVRDRDLVEEYTRKALALGDPDYVAQLKGYQEEFEAALQRIKSTASSEVEQTEISRLAELWRAFNTSLARQQLGAAKVGEFPADLQEILERLQIQNQTVYEANRSIIAGAVEESRKTGEMARLISWCAAAIALVVSVLVSLLIYRSISIPLAHLTAGTRAIAEGKFFYRLDTSRNDEFCQLAKDFNTMTHRLSELDELKKAFVSHVSHELKAPLASMRETIHLMLEGIPGPLTDKQKRLLDLNLQSAARLTSMISNLLDLSKIEAGVMEYEFKSQDLVPLVRSATAELEGQAREKNLRLEPILPEQPLEAECDGDRIIQVLVNLIGNALKFSPSGGAIQIRLQAAAQIPPGMPESRRKLVKQESNGHEFVLVSVSDTGPGIPDPEKESIFERFHQVRRSGKGTDQGVGLGLTICQTIIEAHGGAIWVEDNPRQGSTFQVLLRIRGDGALRHASTPI